MIEQILGWIGNLGFLLGAIFLAKKHIIGFIFQIIANIFYVFQALIMNNYALIWLSIMLIFINVYGIFEWIKQGNIKK